MRALWFRAASDIAVMIHPLLSSVRRDRILRGTALPLDRRILPATWRRHHDHRQGASEPGDLDHRRRVDPDHAAVPQLFRGALLDRDGAPRARRASVTKLGARSRSSRRGTEEATWNS